MAGLWHRKRLRHTGLQSPADVFVTHAQRKYVDDFALDLIGQRGLTSSTLSFGVLMVF
jgi:hypothetical protein